MQFWPRKRAKKALPRIRTWPKIARAKLTCFIGYKTGMTHINLRDNRPNSMTKGQIISMPATIIECPPLKTLSLRFYKKTIDGLKLISEAFSKNLSKELLKHYKIPKKQGKEPENFDEVRLVIYTQPKLTTIGRKKPEIIEMNIPGIDTKERLEYAKSLLDKEVKIADIFKLGQYIDVHAVSKGKGFQGTVKRYGVPLMQHKAEKKKRGIGTLGSWHPHKVQYTVAQPGKMGYHSRVEYNKLIFKISSNPKEINPKSGFGRYGIVKNDYILVKGSIPGPAKRGILLTEPIKPDKKAFLSEIVSINLIK